MGKLRRVLIVFLGLVMVAGTVVSVAQASGMAVDMAVAASMDGGAPGDCKGCPGGDDGNASQCVPVCATTGFALLPPVAANDVRPAAETPPPVHLAARGKPAAPEPYPPKS